MIMIFNDAKDMIVVNRFKMTFEKKSGETLNLKQLMESKDYILEIALRAMSIDDKMLNEDAMTIIDKINKLDNKSSKTSDDDDDDFYLNGLR